jgi:hypothetical protein
MLVPASASAQAADDWKFNAIIYGWFPSLGGKTSFPSNGGGTDIDVNVDKILENLKFVFMGTIEARKGRWGGFTDIIYMDIGGSKSGTRDLTVGGVTLPAGITADANVDIKGTVWTLAGTYRAVGDRDMTVDVLAGARLLDMKQELGWQFSADLGQAGAPLRSGSSSASINNWDAIIGAKGRITLGANHEWFVPYYLDVGTGQSDLTWQAVGGVGYSFKWGEVLAAWRYLDYNFKSGKKVEDLNFNGPMIGVGFRW